MLLHFISRFKFKKIACFIFSLGLFYCNAYGQVTKFKTTSTAYTSVNERTQRWNEWEYNSEGKDILITINLTDERIKIFSKTEQVFDIIKYYEKTTDKDGDDTIAFQCIDSKGLKCKLRIVILNSQSGRKQLYVGYSDINYLYNIYNLD